jgi:hypothetical protein
MPRVHEQLRDRLAEGGVGSPSASSSRQIRKASRAEYVMRPLEFPVAYRGRPWLTDLIRPTAMVSDHWLPAPRLRGGRTRRDGRREHAAVQSGDGVFGTCGDSFAEWASAQAYGLEPKPANLSSLATYVRGGRFLRPPRGRTYHATRATTMTAAAIATTATVEAATTTRRF